MASIRQQRLANQMRTILSELFLREMQDPRLRDVTITEVRIDRELQAAHIYVNALGSDIREETVMAGLEQASGYLRRELGQRMRMRNTPRLFFHWDPLPAQAEYISQLIEGLNIPDEEE